MSALQLADFSHLVHSMKENSIEDEQVWNFAQADWRCV